nr:uncharacterized protein LOC123761433 [Procambarus clarkii]
MTKFTYLQSVLKDEALQVVCNLTFTDDSYDNAIQLLKDNYAKPERTIRLLTQKLLDINPPTTPLVAVYAVRGQTARLPCNLTTAPEDPVIVVLWYKNGTKIPVFSVDFRSRGLQEAGSGSTRPSDAFGGRATFQEQQGGWSWVLVVREVEFTDQGEFRCRLDFQSSPTHNGRVLLRVVGEY